MGSSQLSALAAPSTLEEALWIASPAATAHSAMRSGLVASWLAARARYGRDGSSGAQQAESSLSQAPDTTIASNAGIICPVEAVALGLAVGDKTVLHRSADTIASPHSLASVSSESRQGIATDSHCSTPRIAELIPCSACSRP